MDYLQTITQFITTNDEEYNNKKYNKNACHFFALKTAKEFLKNKELSKTRHESNIYFAIDMNKLYQNHDMYFDEIINFTDLKSNDICITSTILIESKELPLDLIFPDTLNSYCLIILKNSKFFNVIYHENKYYIRDCHEPFQYNFDSKIKMINYLSEIYQFDKSIVVDGFPIPEFSAIEYLYIDKDFELKLENLNNVNNVNKTDIINIINKEEKPNIDLTETEFGISISKINYDEMYEVNIDNDNTEYNKIKIS